MKKQIIVTIIFVLILATLVIVSLQFATFDIEDISFWDAVRFNISVAKYYFIALPIAAFLPIFIFWAIGKLYKSKPNTQDQRVVYIEKENSQLDEQTLDDIKYAQRMREENRILDELYAKSSDFANIYDNFIEHHDDEFPELSLTCIRPELIDVLAGTISPEDYKTIRREEKRKSEPTIFDDI